MVQAFVVVITEGSDLKLSVFKSYGTKLSLTLFPSIFPRYGGHLGLDVWFIYVSNYSSLRDNPNIGCRYYYSTCPLKSFSKQHSIISQHNDGL